MFQRARYMMSLHLPPPMRPPMCLQYIILALGADITTSHRRLAVPFYHRARAYMQADEMRVSRSIAPLTKGKIAENYRERDNISPQLHMHKPGR